VEATEIHCGGGGGGFSFANRNTGAFVETPTNGERWVWYARDSNARLWSGDDKISVTQAGNMGVGVLSPAEKLEVNGNVVMGSGSRYFAVGAPDNAKLFAGSVPIGGMVVNPNWNASHVGAANSGQYRVNFVAPFMTAPVVTVTLVDPQNNDNTICVANVSTTGFDVFSRDIDPGATDGSSPQDSAFNFIAIGQRT
jgi:hypothetical protein